MSIFNTQHYRWLAYFAAEHLDFEQQEALIKALVKNNPNFRKDIFSDNIKSWFAAHRPPTWDEHQQEVKDYALNWQHPSNQLRNKRK